MAAGYKPRVSNRPSLAWRQRAPLFVAACAAPLLGGCGVLRFTHDPEEIGAYDGTIPIVFTETEATDWGDDPSEADIPVIAPGYWDRFEAIRIAGSLTTFGGLNRAPEGSDPRPFQCGEGASVHGRYSGDVDFVKIVHGGGALCVVLGPQPNAMPLDGLRFDVVAYAFDPACPVCSAGSEACAGCDQSNGCLDGDFLSTASVGPCEGGCEPAWTTVGRPFLITTTLAEGETSGTIAMYVAGGSVEDGVGVPAVPVPYEVYVVPRRVPDCNDLSIDTFVEPSGSEGAR